MLRHLWSNVRHRFWVNWELVKLCGRLLWRGQVHDLSKYGPAEAPDFARALPGLASSTYGSEEYEEAKARLDDALEHHYAVNPHHPEHYRRGIDGMTLCDLVEMWCDWKAAVRRHDDGDLRASLEHNRREYDLSDQLYHVLGNTVVRG